MDPRVRKRFTELYIDDHLDALITAGLYTRTVDEDGKEWHQVVGDEMPSKEDVDTALDRYEQIHGGNEP